MRQIWQLEYCKNNHNTYFIWIDSDSQTRYKRLLKNKKTISNYQDFLSVERLDEWTVQNVWKCLEYCSEIIDNNWSIQEFKKKLQVALFSKLEKRFR